MASIPEVCLHDLSNFGAKCRAAFGNSAYIKAEDISINHVQTSIIQTLKNTGGNPNTIQRILDDRPIYNPPSLLIAPRWFYIMLLGFSFLWLIVLLCWCPALCCGRKGRRCWGRCFCKLCCGERDRAFFLYDVKKTKYRGVTWCFLLGVSTFFVAGAVMTFVSYAFFVKGTFEVPYAVRDLSRFVAFGSSMGSQLRFPGLIGIVEISSKAVKDISDASDRLKDDDTRPSVRREWDKSWKEGISMSINLSNKQLEKGITVLTPYSKEGRPQNRAYIHRLVDFPSLVAADSGAIEREIDEADAKVKKSAADGADLLKQKVVTGFDAIVKTLNYESIMADIFKLMDRVLDMAFPSESLTLVIIIGIAVAGLFVPIVLALTWLLLLLCLNRMRKRYIAQKDVDDRKAAKGFGCACCVLAVFGLIALLVGSFMLFVTQLSSEVCYLGQREFLIEGKYSDYKRLSRLKDFDPLLDECATTRGSGNAIEALSKVKGAEGISEVAIEKEKTKIMEQLNKAMGSSEDNLKKITKYVNALGPVARVEKFAPFLPVFNQIWFGGIHKVGDDVKYLPQPDETANNAVMNLMRGQIINAFNAVANAKFPTTRTDITRELELPTPQNFATIDVQVKRLDDVLKSECSDAKVCYEAGCCSGHSGACASIGDKRVFSPLADGEDKLTQILASAKESDNEALATCLEGLSKASQVMWINSHYALSTTADLRPLRNFVAYKDSTASTVAFKGYVDHIKKEWTNLSTGNATKTVATDFTNSIFGVIDNLEASLKCNGTPFFAGIGNLLCGQLSANLSLTGVGYILLAVGAAVGFILVWKLYHHFKDNTIYFGDKKHYVECIEDGDLRRVTKLSQHISAKDFVDADGNGILHFASYNDKPDIVQFGLSKGCDPNAVNRAGFAPLNIAVASGSTECTRLLTEAGGDIEHPSPWGESPVANAERRHRNDLIHVLETCSPRGRPDDGALNRSASSLSQSSQAPLSVSKPKSSASSVRSDSSDSEGPPVAPPPQGAIEGSCRSDPPSAAPCSSASSSSSSSSSSSTSSKGGRDDLEISP